MKYSVRLRWVVLLCAALGMASCGVESSVYQKQQQIPGSAWSSKFQPVFKIEIKDTTSAYFTELLVRHDESYPNSNIWIRLKVKAPGDSVFRDGERIEKTMANAAGVWQGTGMGNIWEERLLLSQAEGPKFKKPGIYEIKLEQLMRNDPLPAVLNGGLRIEKKNASAKK